MQRLAISFLTCLICLTLSGISPLVKAQEQKTSEQKVQSDSWIKVAPKDVGFTVLMPAAPQERLSSMEIAAMKVPAFSYTANIGKTTFLVAKWGEFPEQLVTAGYLTVWFDNAHKIFFETKGEDGKKDTMPFTQRDISLSGYSGREYVADCGPYKKIDEPCSNTIRIYKVERSLFVLAVAGPKSTVTAERVDKFFSSFALTK